MRGEQLAATAVVAAPRDLCASVGFELEQPAEPPRHSRAWRRRVKYAGLPAAAGIEISSADRATSVVEFPRVSRMRACSRPFAEVVQRLTPSAARNDRPGNADSRRHARGRRGPVDLRHRGSVLKYPQSVQIRERLAKRASKAGVALSESCRSRGLSDYFRAAQEMEPQGQPDLPAG